MSHRPYPSPGRARHQLARHERPVPAVRVGMSPAMQRAYDQWAPFREAFQADVAALAARSAAEVAALRQGFTRPAATSGPGSSR